MKSNIKTREIDRGYKKLRQEIKKASGARVDVGYFGAEVHPESKGETIVSIAATHEYGNPKENIPERSFLRSTADAKKTAYDKRLKAGLVGITTGKTTVEKELVGFGEMARGDVVLKIQAIKEPPLAALTILLKGSTKPLIDTGAMMNAAGYRVIIEGNDRTPKTK